MKLCAACNGELGRMVSEGARSYWERCTVCNGSGKASDSQPVEYVRESLTERFLANHYGQGAVMVIGILVGFAVVGATLAAATFVMKCVLIGCP